ncbi:IS5/IS1182 family transposase, partial [Bacillus sp. SRB_28]
KVPAVPDYQEILDHHEAKEVMKNYLEEVIDQVEEKTSVKEQRTGEIIQKAKEIVDDPKFISQKGIRSIIDEDARVGRKSKTQDFFGYKTEFVMTTDERIITSVRTANGANTDGSFTKEMFADTKKSGMIIEEVYGDKAYFRKPILDDIEERNASAYIPVSATVYRLDESEYTYNKDSDEWQCSQGNTTVAKKRYTSKRREGVKEGYKYYFDINQCKACPLHDACAKK